MTDISVYDGRACSINIETRVNGHDSNFQVDFNDLYYDGSPIQFEPQEVCGYKVDANGKFYTWRTKKPIVFSISMIPFSLSDIRLTSILYACRQSVGMEADIRVMEIKYSSFGIKLLNGIMVSGMPGTNATGDNRMGPRTYRFAFNDVL